MTCSLLLVSAGVMWHLLSNLPIRVFQYWNNIATQMKFCQLLSCLGLLYLRFFSDFVTVLIMFVHFHGVNGVKKVRNFWLYIQIRLVEQG